MVHVVWGIIIASGKEEQLMATGVDVAFLNLAGRPLLSHALEEFERCPDIDGIVVVAPKDRVGEVLTMAKLMGYMKLRKIAAGTVARISSLRMGLNTLDEEVSMVVVHEVSRPCVKRGLISECIKAAKRYGSGVAASRILDPVKIVPKGNTVTATLEPNTAWTAQTPQAYKLDVLEKALAAAAKKKVALQDESAALELIKHEVHLVPCPPSNIRIANPEDLTLAEALKRL
ncbi:MAG: 2-C-methyl-D-erythritol 4-phosphate cytidylyltransferase [Kiritimatiellia bacterium]